MGIRNFGDIQDETVINAMKPTGEEKYDLLALRELNNVFERISNCVVTTLPKCDEGLEVIGYFLPWLQRNAEYDCETKVNVIRNQVKSQLPVDSEKAILKHNFVDELVYDFIDKLFEEQLKFARANRKSDALPVPINRAKLKTKAKEIVKRIQSKIPKVASNKSEQNELPSTDNMEHPESATLRDNEDTQVDKEESVNVLSNDNQPSDETPDLTGITNKDVMKDIDTSAMEDATKQDESTPVAKASDTGDHNLPVDVAMKKEMAELESNIISSNPDNQEKESVPDGEEKVATVAQIRLRPEQISDVDNKKELINDKSQLKKSNKVKLKKKI